MSSRPRKKRATVEPPRAEHLESLERGLLVLELNTVRRYLRSGGYVVYQQPARESALNGLDSWLNERLQRHRGNADVVRQDLQREHRLAVSLPTVERAVAPFRRVLRAAEMARRYSTGSCSGGKKRGLASE